MRHLAYWLFRGADIEVVDLPVALGGEDEQD
jgi:hypothetical protein